MNAQAPDMGQPMHQMPDGSMMPGADMQQPMPMPPPMQEPTNGGMY